MSYGLAVGVCVLSVLTSVLAEPATDSRFIVVAIPLALVGSLPSRRWRAPVLAAGAGAVAAWVPDAVFLWPALAALVFVAVAEDLHEPPWVGWVGGLTGSIFSLVLFPDNANLAPFVATALGGAGGMLLRSTFRTDELVGEAEQLRSQAEWLEQRTSVARELHDVVGHHVTAMVVQAEAGQVADPHDALRTIGELGRTALAELDSLVVHLRDPGAPLSVSAPPRLLDIDELLAEPLRRSGVAVAVDVRLDDQPGLDERDLLTVYRITQEALTNVARHARARRAWVELDRDVDCVRLRVSDDGVGPRAERPRGSGLLGIEERVTARGGSWELAERTGGGALLDVRLPLGTR